MRTEIEDGALRFFLLNSNPRTGLVRDHALNFASTPNTASYNVASIAATGFGMAVIANAASRGLVSRHYAERYLLKVLRFSKDHVARHKGWFIHFFDWSTGANSNDSEYSTIDTALFLAGALYAAEVFPYGRIAKMAEELYADVDFQDMLTDGNTQPTKKTLSQAYSDSTGYTEAQWDDYAEEMLLLLLGLGSPTNPLPSEVWNSWHRESLVLPSGETLVGYDKPLFTHQYSQIFIDFRPYRDGHIDYFQNGKLGSNYNRTVCQNDRRYRTFRSGFWGLSAGNSPDGYYAYSPQEYDGTVCIGCVMASAMYLPDEILNTAYRWRHGEYGDLIWGQYGFTDGINLDRHWISPLVYGITLGPAFLALANTDNETSLWSVFDEIPAIKNALKIAFSERHLMAQNHH
jgi:hypothetical protein